MAPAALVQPVVGVSRHLCGGHAYHAVRRRHDQSAYDEYYHYSYDDYYHYSYDDYYHYYYDHYYYYYDFCRFILINNILKAACSYWNAATPVP